MTDYDVATLMSGVREYAESYPVKIGEVAADEKHGPTERRLVVMALNEAGHNITLVDVRDMLKWLVEHRPELVREAMITRFESAKCPPGFLCVHDVKCPGTV